MKIGCIFKLQRHVCMSFEHSLLEGVFENEKKSWTWALLWEGGMITNYLKKSGLVHKPLLVRLFL
jgi:hypothetical protein